MRNKRKGGNIRLVLKINEKARFEIVNIDSLIEPDNRHRRRIYNMVDAFPLWLVDEEIDNIELILGVM